MCPAGRPGTLRSCNTSVAQRCGAQHTVWKGITDMLTVIIVLLLVFLLGGPGYSFTRWRPYR